MLACPVFYAVVAQQLPRQITTDRRRKKNITQLEPQTRHLVIHLEQASGIINVYQGDPPVILVHAHLEYTNHRKTPQPRQQPGRPDGDLG